MSPDASPLSALGLSFFLAYFFFPSCIVVCSMVKRNTSFRVTKIKKRRASASGKTSKLREPRSAFMQVTAKAVRPYTLAFHNSFTLLTSRSSVSNVVKPTHPR